MFLDVVCWKAKTSKMTDSTKMTTMTNVPTSAPPSLVRTITCGGTLTYCGHAGCPDMTKWRDEAPKEERLVYKFDREKYTEHFRNNPYTSGTLTATASCGGTLIYCGHPWCTDMTKR